MEDSCCYLFSFQVSVQLISSIFILLYLLQIGLRPLCKVNYVEQIIKWVIIYLGLYVGYLIIGYKYFSPGIAYGGYWYLLALGIISFSKFLFIIIKHNFKDQPIKVELFILLISIGILSIIQLFQTISLLQSIPNIGTWWVPMFCKHSSLILYISILTYIKWELKHLDLHCIHKRKDKCMPIVGLWVIILSIVIPIIQIPISLFRIGLSLDPERTKETSLSFFIDFFWSPMFSIFLIWFVILYIVKYAHCITTRKSRFDFDKTVNWYSIFMSLIIGFMSGHIFLIIENILNWHDAYVGFIVIIFAMVGFMFEGSVKRQDVDKYSIISYSYLWLWGVLLYYFILCIGD